MKGSLDHAFFPKEDWLNWLQCDSYGKRLAQHYKHKKMPTFMQGAVYFYFIVCAFKVSALSNSFPRVWSYKKDPFCI